MEKRKLMALASSAAMVMASMGIAPAVMADEVEKPEKITVMFDGTVFTQENGQAEFEARWEELTGIDLQIIQPDHSQYYDVLGQTIAGGDWPDVVLLGSTYYASYAAEGVLWDMTEAYDNSELKERITDQSVIDGLKIDGSLYGISPARGNGCITYVKKAWLDNCGLEVPTTYDEYLAMLWRHLPLAIRMEMVLTAIHMVYLLQVLLELKLHIQTICRSSIRMLTRASTRMMTAYG